MSSAIHLAHSEGSDQTGRMGAHANLLILTYTGSNYTVEPRYLELAYFELPLISK